MTIEITGIGCTPFGDARTSTLRELGATAVTEALVDAGLQASDVDVVFVANSFAGVTTAQASVVGQSVMHECGIGRVPLYNIDNACAGSGSLLALARMAILSGDATRVLVVGVEKMLSDDARVTTRALNAGADEGLVDASGVDRDTENLFIAQLYPALVAGYAKRFALTPVTLAKIAVKNRVHASMNPRARYRTPLQIDDVLAAKPVGDLLTTLMCAPVADGASAAIIEAAGSRAVASDRAVAVAATYSAMGGARADGPTAVEAVARRAYDLAGIDASAIDVAEVNDSTAFGELRACELLSLCDAGGASELVDSEATSLGGSVPVNVSGGLCSRGHAVAATGLAQVYELVTQLRGEAGERQVSGACTGLAHNNGGFVGGDAASIAVTVLRRT